MSLRVGVLQCELSHLHNPPHLGPSLLVTELEDAGHTVDRWLVHVTRLESMAEEVHERGCELVAIDSIFPVDVVRRFLARLGPVPVVVGGLNALAVFEQTPCAFAIVGPARRALAELVRALEHGRACTRAEEQRSALDGVPNLFYRWPAPPAFAFAARVSDSPGSPRSGLARDRLFLSDGDAPGDFGAAGAIPFGREIDVSSTERAWDLEEELFPFRPPLEWEYRGPSGRHPHADRHGVSLIPEWGCPYQSRHRLSDGCHDDARVLRPAGYTDRAWARVVRLYLDDVEACSFCIFRFQSFTSPRVEQSVEYLLTQTRYYWEAGLRSFALQSENPFRVLRPFWQALRAEGRAPEELRLRTMVSILKSHESEISNLLHEIASEGTRIEVTQVGFESFVDRSLRLFHKGVSNWDNRRAARFLQSLDRQAGGRIRTIHGHGLILFDPWTTLEELEENLDAIEQDAPFLKGAVALDSKLYLYSRYAPIAREVRSAGLLEETSFEFGLDYRYAHEETTLFREIASLGLAPLLESVGRMKIDGVNRRRLAIEGRFRWFRELARHVRAERAARQEPRRSWGQVLASVIRGLGLEA